MVHRHILGCIWRWYIYIISILSCTFNITMVCCSASGTWEDANSPAKPKVSSFYDHVTQNLERVEASLDKLLNDKHGDSQRKSRADRGWGAVPSSHAAAALSDMLWLSGTVASLLRSGWWFKKVIQGFMYERMDNYRYYIYIYYLLFVIYYLLFIIYYLLFIFIIYYFVFIIH